MSALLTRPQWGGINVRFDPLSVPVSTLFLHHTVTPWSQPLAPACRDLEAHALRLGHRAIDYSLVHTSYGGRAEGRGYFAVGGHTLNWNSRSLGLVALGDYRYDAITDTLLNELAQSIRDGIALGAIAANYVLRPHSDVFATACPARLAASIDEIKRRAAAGGDDDVKGLFMKKAEAPHVWLLVGNEKSWVRNLDALNGLAFLGYAHNNTVHTLDAKFVDAIPIATSSPNVDGSVTGGGGGGGLSEAQVRAIVTDVVDGAKVTGTIAA